MAGGLQRDDVGLVLPAALQDSHLLRSGFPAAFRLRHDTPGLMALTQHVPSTPQMQRRQL